jgi:hypothetical protein
VNLHYHERAPLLVVTATLGVSPWLEATVRSVAEAAGLAAAHVLIAPERRTAELRERFPACCVLRESPDARSLYGALNEALRACAPWGWRWMTIVADDDLLLPGFRRLYRQAEQVVPANCAALWHGEVEMIDAGGRFLCRVPYVRRTEDVAALVAAGYSPFNHQSVLYSRRAVELAGPFVSGLRVCADAAHWLRAIELGADVHHLPLAAAAFRVRAGQISGDIAVHQREFAALRPQALRMHGPRPLWPAVLRFRVANLGVYLERIRRVGFSSGYDLLKTT